MKNKIRQKYTGFTLIELLIAMSVGTLIAMAFFTIVNTSIKNNAKNEQDIKLLNIASSEIENIREQIKDTNKDSLVVNTIDKEDNRIFIELDGEGNIELVSGGNADEYELNGNVLNYKSNVEDIIYNTSLDISRVSTQNTHLYLYSIDLKSKLEKSNFNKKEIHLQTKIFGK